MRMTHPLAGKTVELKLAKDGPGIQNGDEYRIEDWWQNVAGMSWMEAKGNPAALLYAMRSGFGGPPADDEVVYGKIGSLGHLVHVSELGSEITE